MDHHAQKPCHDCHLGGTINAPSLLVWQVFRCNAAALYSEGDAHSHLVHARGKYHDYARVHTSLAVLIAENAEW